MRFHVPPGPKFLKPLVVLLAVLLASGVGAQTVQQSGTVTPTHPTRWVTTGVIGDGGSATNGYLGGVGIFANGGLSSCIDASTVARASFNPASSPYTQLCWQATMGGASGLTLQSYNGASPSTLSFTVNGTTQTFPFSGGGGVTIPNNTVLGNNSGGSLAAFALTQPQLTALIQPFTSSTSGAVPASGGSANQYLTGVGTFTGVSLASLGNIAAKSVLGNGTAGSAPITAAFTVPNITDTLLASVHGAATTSDCVAFNATDGSLKDAGGPCTTGGGGGTVSSGTANQLGYYATTGTTISGLTSGNNSVLVTGASGIPSIATTLPSALTYPTPTITGVITDSTFRANLTTSTTVSGGLVAANTPLWISGTASGTGTGFSVPQQYLNEVETVTNTTAGTSIDGLFVNHAFGTGEGIRIGVHSQLDNTGATAGASADGFASYVSVSGTALALFTDGGSGFTPTTAKGDFFGFGGIAEAQSGATFLHGVVGGEADVSVQSGASTREKMGFQVVTINSDAVKGSVVDAGILLTADSTTTAQLDYGLVFGKPGMLWPVSGTLIGTYTGSGGTGAMNSVNGIDFSNVTFSGAAIHTPGFFVDHFGNVSGLAYGGNSFLYAPVSAPSNPVTSGAFVVYANGGTLLAKNASGTTYQLAPLAASGGTVTAVTCGTGLTCSPSTIATTGSVSQTAVANLTVQSNISGGAAVPTASGLAAVINAIFGGSPGQVLTATGGGTYTMEGAVHTAATGHLVLPNGLILNWGAANVPANSTSTCNGNINQTNCTDVTFDLPFPTAALIGFASLVGGYAGSATAVGCGIATVGNSSTPKATSTLIGLGNTGTIGCSYLYIGW